MGWFLESWEGLTVALEVEEVLIEEKTKHQEITIFKRQLNLILFGLLNTYYHSIYFIAQSLAMYWFLMVSYSAQREMSFLIMK